MSKQRVNKLGGVPLPVTRMPVLALAMIAASTFSSPRAFAGLGDNEISAQAWACSENYGQIPIAVRNGRDFDAAICLGEGTSGRPPMSREQAYAACREQFSATSLLLRWTSKGWLCRYYGH